MPENTKKERSNIFFARSVILVIAALSQLLFLLSQNQHLYSTPQIIASLVFVTIFCLVLYWVCISAVIFLRRSNKKPAYAITFFKIKLDIYLFLASIVGFFILCLVYGILRLQGRIDMESHPLLFAGIFALILFTIGIGYSSLRSRVMSAMLYVCVLISITYILYGRIRDVLPGSRFAFHNDTKQTIEKVQFKIKPNIYLFLLESFHSREVLKDVYGLDTVNFANELTNRGYTLYDPVYANYYSSLTSVSSIFRMDHSYYQEYRGKMDVTHQTHRIISGVSYNRVLDTLNKNGYSIAYIHSSYALYRCYNKNIDYSNLKFPFAGLLQPVFDIDSVMYAFTRSMLRLNRVVRDTTRAIFLSPLDNASLKPQPVIVNSDERLRQLVSHIKASKSEQPVFRFIYWLGVDHTENQIARVSEKTKLEYASSWKSTYRYLVQKAEAEIIKIALRIEQDDPDALVILIGDHGAWLKGRMAEGKSTSLDELRKTAADYSFTLADLAKDVSSVFLAIKWPKGVSVPMMQTISHVNLFRFIFSVLSDDEALMRNAVPNTSYFLLAGSKPKVFTMVKEGIVLDEWGEQ